MTQQAVVNDEDTTVLVDPDETQTTEDAQAEPDQTQTDAEPETVVVSIGDESPPSDEEEQQAAAPWVRDLRKKQQELSRENRELKQKLEAQTAPKTPVVGPKPTLAGCEYDEERLELEMGAWLDAKAKADAESTKQRKEQEDATAAFEAKRTAYSTGKGTLQVKDFDEAEHAATEVLSTLQQNLILAGAENAALLVYALGKNPKEAAKLASIKDPVQFAFAAARLESKLKVTPRKAPPPPETSPRGSAPAPGSSDVKLDRLIEDAQKTGNMDKVRAYRKSLRK